MLRVVREGVGRGAVKQYDLLRGHWRDDSLSRTTSLYFNAFTRNIGELEEKKRRGHLIVARVGGWHFDSADVTQRVLEMSDAAIYVSDYTRQLAHKYFKGLPDREAVIVNAVGRANRESIGRPPYLLVRAGGIGYPVCRKGMLCRSLSVFCIHAIWPQLRARYPSIRLLVRGKTDHEIKEKVIADGIQFMEYTDDERILHREGSRASALIHLVIGDHSPNTAAEAVGEGRPVVVLDRGGARELVGRAGIVVPTNLSGERSDIDTWWPLDEQIYRPDLDHLFSAVCDAVDGHEKWRGRANGRAEEISPAAVAKRYSDFVDSL